MTAGDSSPRPSSPSASPRTDLEPFAFTRTEFLAGAGRAWLWTTLLLIAAWAVLSGGLSLVVGSVMILVASIPAVVVGAPGAYALGRRLRRSPRVEKHLVLFVVYGAVVGALTTMLVGPVVTGTSEGFSIVPLFALVNVPLSAISVASAWFVTMRKALRADAAGFGDGSVSARDVDAAVEDALEERYRVIDPRQRPRG